MQLFFCTFSLFTSVADLFFRDKIFYFLAAVILFFALTLNFCNPMDHKILSLNCLGGDKTPQGGNQIKSVTKEGAKKEEEKRGKEDRQTKGRSA